LVHRHAEVSCAQPAGSPQLSTVQVIPSLHGVAGPPHTPAVHKSPVVQAFPSLQPVPSIFAGFEQLPLTVSHEPGV
jgi:hypothetical protein